MEVLLYHEHLEVAKAPLAPLCLVVVGCRLLNGHVGEMHVCE